MVSNRISSKHIWATALAFFMSLIFIIPFYLLANMATYRTEDLYTKFTILPSDYFFENLKTVQNGLFVGSMGNSLFVSVFATAISVFVSALIGFAISKYQFRGKKFLFNFVLLTMMIPSGLGIIAFVIEMRILGFVDTFVPLILVFGASSYGAFWMTQYIGGCVPLEVIESARIDGCNEFNIFIRIVIPFIKPAIFTLSILVFLWSWNNYLMPIVILNSASKFTIPLAVATLGSMYFQDHAARITGLMLGIMPLFIIFVLGSRIFVKGLSDGAVKG